MPSSLSKPVTRHASGATPVVVEDQLAVEEPLEIRVEGRSVAITMRTPGTTRNLPRDFF